MEALVEGWWGVCLASFLGLSVGSFANVAVYRVPREGLSVLRPSRSFCPACNAQLTWFDNVPLLSWLLLRGRCRSCRSPIAWRYPAVELLVGLLFVGSWLVFAPQAGGSWLPLMLAWVVCATCVVVSAIDLEHFIIPDVITLPGIALGLLASLTWPALHAAHEGFDAASPHGSSLVVAFMGLVACGGSLYLIGLLGNLMLKRQVQEAGVEDAMGLGDVKWMAFAGTFLGPLLVLEAILVGCFTGALVGIVLKVVARVRGGAGPVGLPFGPFLSIGILLELYQPGAAWAVMSLLRP
jgi:leader peptidase (prepilin peptidase)/N-methyltransferase